MAQEIFPYDSDLSPWAEGPVIRAATHGCPHHVDELVALALLRAWAEERGRTVEIAFLDRKQVETEALTFDVLVDIGLIHDPVAGRFDHHQGGAEVEGRSAAGLIFDHLYLSDLRRPYLEPIIHFVDLLDTGGIDPSGPPGSGSVTLSALLKAHGAFRNDPARSLACFELVEPLVRRWLEQATDHLRAEELAARGERVGAGVFLPTDEGYGPALLDHLREAGFAFVGCPAGQDRFQVVALRGQDGRNRICFPSELAGATFVHPRGFMAVFPDRDLAAGAVAGLRPQPSTDC